MEKTGLLEKKIRETREAIAVLKGYGSAFYMEMPNGNTKQCDYKGWIRDYESELEELLKKNHGKQKRNNKIIGKGN